MGHNEKRAAASATAHPAARTPSHESGGGSRGRIVAADYVLSWEQVCGLIGFGGMLDVLRGLYGQLGWKAGMGGAPSPGGLRIRRYPECIVVSREQVIP